MKISILITALILLTSCGGLTKKASGLNPRHLSKTHHGLTPDKFKEIHGEPVVEGFIPAGAVASFRAPHFVMMYPSKTAMVAQFNLNDNKECTFIRFNGKKDFKFNGTGLSTASGGSCTYQGHKLRGLKEVSASEFMKNNK